MKKIIFMALMVFSLLTVTSCDTYPQSVIYDDGFVYEYSYNSCPVRYINGVAYYYCLYNNIWTWVILDRIYYNRIIHHPHPVRYVYPHNHYNRYYGHNIKPYQRQIVPDRTIKRSQHGGNGTLTGPNGHITRPSNNGGFDHRNFGANKGGGGFSRHGGGRR